MASSSEKIDIYLEIGQKKTFASAVDWPGWSRSGRDETSARQALLEYAPRYEALLRPAGLDFPVPADTEAFTVVERLEGSSTTDFGAPAATPSADTEPVDEAELRRFEALLQAFWQALDAVVEKAGGRELRKGPRGGGRELEKIIRHLLDSDAGYLASLGWKFKWEEGDDLEEEQRRSRQAILEGLNMAVRGEIPAKGPRGGARWTPRYFVRRLAWHTLDHIWEIEDRLT